MRLADEIDQSRNISVVLNSGQLIVEPMHTIVKREIANLAIWSYTMTEHTFLT